MSNFFSTSYHRKKGKDWYPICIIDGFKNKREAMQCEWKFKGIHGRLQYIIK